MTSYTTGFYEKQRARSNNSALAIAPELLRLINPQSVLDVGCGTGVWLAAFDQLGVKDYLGLDGDWVREEVLAIPKEKFRSSDLSQPIDLGRKFDLAISMEVGEHLPTGQSQTFVDNITRHAPAVLFSAAIPCQGGTDHINEQWQSWWAEKFAHNGYRAIDCMRKTFWHDPEVQSWYAQNMILYVDESAIGQYPLVPRELVGGPLDVVHPSAFLIASDLGRKSVFDLAKQLPKAAFKAIKRRIVRK